MTNQQQVTNPRESARRSSPTRSPPGRNSGSGDDGGARVVIGGGPRRRSSSGSRAPSKLPLGVLACSALLLLLACSGGVGADGIPELFRQLKCKGVPEMSFLARLDRICEDCYNLFHVAQLKNLCRDDCFTSTYFKGCLEALLITGDDEETVKTYIKHLHGADPEL